MTMLNRPVCFTATADAPVCRSFYESTLGLKCVSDDQFALVFDVGSTTLRIQKVEAVAEINYTVLGWDVVDIRRCVDELTGNGVRFETYPQLPQDELGIWNTPGGAKVAWFKDPDGNTLSLTESAGPA